jgi:hypothetical protein
MSALDAALRTLVGAPRLLVALDFDSVLVPLVPVRPTPVPRRLR